jgi:hypothetical protein
MKSLCLILTFVISFSASLHAIRDESNQERWEKPYTKGPDKAVPGFLINMGPTGARAILTEKTLVVKYIFPNTPAVGKLQLNDVVYGAFGKEFASHTFGGRGPGIDGPIFDLGMAIEEAEGSSSGKLTLMVSRKGNHITVDVPLEKLGRYSNTWPENCKKTETLRRRAYKYLQDNPGGTSSQGRCVNILALLTSGIPEFVAEGKRRALGWNKRQREGTWSWHLGFQSIALAEYHLLTGDDSVLDTLKDTLRLLRRAQYKITDKVKISIWEAAEGGGQAKTDKHQSLYEGGFGHSPFPFQNADAPGGRGKGYGPMQFPTIVAAIAWQLGEQCGLKVEHEGVKKAFQFIDYGTTNGGTVAYGGEFTLNNGPIDWVKWKSRTGHGGSAKSGLALTAYRLSSEFDFSESYIKLHISNIRASYKDMADNHADPLMALTWGWVGTGASQNEELKKQVFAYYKAWLNVSRCHGSASYVMLPGRNYADHSYYIDSMRTHMTSAVALLYGFANPKLQIQGVQIAIPGLNHKALVGPEAVAYKAILEGKYGHAAKLISEKGTSSGGAGEHMLSFLNKKVQAQLKSIEGKITEGHWQEVQEFFGKQGIYWSGVPYFDSKHNFFKSLLTDKGGKLLLKADSMYNQSHFGQAFILAKQATSGTAIEEVKKSSSMFSANIERLAAEYAMTLKHMEVKGEWYTLYGHLKKIPKTYGGIEAIDKLAAKLSPAFKEPSGKALAIAHKHILVKDYSKAYKSILQIVQQAKVERHKKIAAKVKGAIEAAVAEKVAKLQSVKQSGNWATLYINLSLAKKTYAGIEEFNKFYTKNVPLIRSSAGKVLVSSEKLINSGKYSLASKGLKQVRDSPKFGTEIKEISGSVLSRISSMIKPLLESMNSLETAGDWYTLQMEIKSLNRTLSGVEMFDEVRTRLEKKFRENDVRNLIKVGAEFSELKRSWLKRSTPGKKEKLQKFQKANASNIYGKKAKVLIGN